MHTLSANDAQSLNGVEKIQASVDGSKLLLACGLVLTCGAILTFLAKRMEGLLFLIAGVVMVPLVLARPRGIAVTLTDTYVHDVRWGIGFLRWNDIDTVLVRESHGTLALGFVLKNPERASKAKGNMTMRQAAGLGHLHIGLQMLSVSPQEIVSFVERVHPKVVHTTFNP